MPNTISATEALRLMQRGVLSSVDLVQACLNRIEETDGQIKAWAHLDPEHALAQAAELDEIRRSGRPVGPLHGIPVGLKDIIDTRDYPTERGTPIFAGRHTKDDAALVERLREAGAVIMGKTVTTELAFMNPSQTRNPHDPAHTPGGSSSGSAAAVAACHVPLAVGTQTNGSVIRPASFCGVWGFKPTRGVISRRGVLRTSLTLDQIGVFARTLEDAALLADVLAGYDPSDPLSYPRPRPAMLEGARAEAPVEPDFIWLDLPFHDRLSPDAREGYEELLEALGEHVERLPASPNLAALVDVQRTIHEYELVQHLNQALTDGREMLSDAIMAAVERGRAITRAEYEDAIAVMHSAEDFYKLFFRDYDAIIAPSAAGEAPLFEEGTGDPIFCSAWTVGGLPTLNVPLLVGGRGLPVGVQLIGAAEEDDRLLRTAGWMLKYLENLDNAEDAEGE